MVSGTGSKGAACRRTNRAALRRSTRLLTTRLLRERILSSASRASLRQCVLFSTDQWPRTRASHWAWVRSPGLRLEMWRRVWRAVLRVFLLYEALRTVTSARQYGKPDSRGLRGWTQTERVSARPWPLR